MTYRDKSRFHSLEPGYKRPTLTIPDHTRVRIVEKLSCLYGEENAGPIYEEIKRVMKSYYAYKTSEMLKWEWGFRSCRKIYRK